VYDPEVGVNIVDLGLVYGLEIDGREVRITITLTTPACPLGDLIREDINERMRESYPSVESVRVEIVWDPPWSPEAITAEGKLQLGWSV
jgi:metal-sulfur cluster biosynthetic enzyme